MRVSTRCLLSALITGPIWLCSSRPEPTRSPAAVRAAESRKVVCDSATVTATETARQRCPAQPKALSATTLVAACIVVPQIVVALFSPAVGRLAERAGRRPILLVGFAALPIRALLFLVVADPRLLVAVQVLDGVCAAVFGVLVPLTIADVTRGTGRFNLAQGIVGSASGVGAG